MVWIPIFLGENIGDVSGARSMVDGDFIIRDGFANCVLVNLKVPEVFCGFALGPEDACHVII